jgi:two-component system cell cycle sensor histidine kinase/response regulator CckA
MLGYTVEEMMGKKLFDFMDERGIEIAKEKIENRISGIKEHHEFEFLHKNGQTVYTIMETGPIIENGKYLGAIAGVQDITYRVMSESKLKDSEEKFAKAFQTAPYAVTITHPKKGEFVEVNDAFVSISGFTREEATSSSSTSLKLWVNESDREDVLSSLMTGKPVVDLEFFFRRKSGEIFVGLFSSNIIQLNKEPHVISSIRDLTDIKIAEKEKKRLAAQLQQSQKMEIIGRLAAGVAHNFNNLLTVIKGYTSLMLADAKYYTEELLEIEKASNRAALLTKQLLAFSRKQVLSPIKTNANDISQNLRKMLATLVGESVKITYNLEKNIGIILADPAQIEQVIINLASNSKDAMNSVGEILIETKNVKIDEDFISKYGDAIVGDYIMISITDRGSGMSKEIMDRMWEPFFTTKEKNKGTGLGLPTVFGIIKQSNGYIFAESEVGKGTTFRIYLPLVPIRSILSRESDFSKHKENLTGTETILLVEDEDIVRDFTKKLLESNGYKVLEAEDGEKAIEISNSFKDRIPLLLTDVVLSKMNGKELSDILSKNRPNCKVIFISGYTENTVIHQGILVDGVNFLQKPYDITELLTKIRRVLDS